jgi:hypothetical protein
MAESVFFHIMVLSPQIKKISQDSVLKCRNFNGKILRSDDVIRFENADFGTPIRNFGSLGATLTRIQLKNK